MTKKLGRSIIQTAPAPGSEPRANLEPVDEYSRPQARRDHAPKPLACLDFCERQWTEGMI